MNETLKSRLELSEAERSSVMFRDRSKAERRAALAAVCLCVSLACSAPEGEPVSVFRDVWGIPHIYAESAQAGLYASGWAQAEDRLEQVLKNYLLGLGRYAEAFGPGDDDRWVRSDFESRMWDHYGTSQRFYEQKLNPELRRHIEAFVAGINDYMAAHPEEVPEWWGSEPVDRYMPVAFSRQFIWGWPAGQAASDLREIGLQPSFDVDFRASNEIAIAPSRTTFGAAALVIDPHLSWFGRQRYWEVRLHAGDIHISGFATAGFPYVNLGHNDHVAWAHTTGGPDTADVYELTLDESETRYRYDEEWRDLELKDVEITVKGEAEPRRRTFRYSHHGPVIAKSGAKAYAAALAYEDEIGYLESKYWFMVAADYEGAKKALEVRQIMPQNVMVADTAGNIYYQRTGRVPIRPDGYDWSRPVDGSTSSTEWLGVHPADDLMSVLNPPQGSMQNCNIGPDVMMLDSPFAPETTKTYLYNQPKHLIHQRGASALAHLAERTEPWSQEEILELALDTRVYQAERWIAELAPLIGTLDESAGDLFAALEGWDGRSDAESRGALVYYLWRHALLEVAGRDAVSGLSEKIDDYLLLVTGEDRRQPLDEDDKALLVQAFEQAVELAKDQGLGEHATFGDVFRVGRLDASDEVSWPVGGGSLQREGMATMRSIGFGSHREDFTRWGERGQTSTEVVFLTTPIRSYTQPPIGQSDRPDSPHYRDQARELFSKARFKPAWFAREELEDGNVSTEQTLLYPGPSAAEASQSLEPESATD